MHPKLTKNSFFNFPSIDKLPDFNQSLKMINTENVFPNLASLEDIQLPLQPTPQEEEDSLGERISFVPTNTNSAKKKKIGCTCKKTFCLKMYCECFSTGKECGEDCACIGCKNNEDFKQEIQQAKTATKQGGLRNRSLAQKRCNCKKSNCLKRYCECYNSGVGCSESCRCQGCKNTQKPQPVQQSASKQQEVALVAANTSNLLNNSFDSIKKYGSLDDFQKYYD